MHSWRRSFTDSTGDRPVYGHDPGGQRFPLTIINRKNVGTESCLTYRTETPTSRKRQADRV
jgi:hypothetical protein